jgi:hypothetical protein
MEPQYLKDRKEKERLLHKNGMAAMQDSEYFKHSYAQVEK